MTEEKNQIRKKIKALLADKKNHFEEWSLSICKKIIDSPEFSQATIILAYMALGDEVNLSLAIDQALLQGKKVYIPRIIPDSNLMDFYAYDKNNCKKASFGIEEPDLSQEKFDIEKVILQSANKKENILVLVPGRAFTKDGKRLGRGKAFYDLYLNKIIKKTGDSTNCKISCLGICFNCQLLPDLPIAAHDILMQKVIFQE
ncbi:MAG: 5-formyltetrahydrofolate cyclo-ligase [Treponema sp.]|nr:5-formyltetrahydrofolate cyclo-ligase [Treponema sp.]